MPAGITAQPDVCWRTVAGGRFGHRCATTGLSAFDWRLTDAVAEPPGLSGNRARVPQPTRNLTSGEVAHVRGEADSIALKVRHHNRALHAKRMPQGQMARSIYEAVEQTRCESIGSNRMAGVQENLTAALEQRYRKKGFERITERSDATLVEVVRVSPRGVLRLVLLPGRGEQFARDAGEQTLTRVAHQGEKSWRQVR